MFRLGKRKQKADPLDRVLWKWNTVDSFTRRDLLRSACVIGASGSGKSSSFGLNFGIALALDRQIGGLILASKPEDREFWERIFTACGRSEDLLIMDDSGGLRFNLLQHELDSGADPRELTQLLMVVSETLNRGQCQGGGDTDPFFRNAGEIMLHHAIEIVTRATGRLDSQLLQEFITDHAQVPDQIKSEAWQKGLHNNLLEAAYGNARTPRQKHDFQLAWSYWIKFLPALNDRTRSSIEAGVLNILFALNNGLAHSLLTGNSNITPAVLDEGKWWLVDLSVSNYGAAGAFVNGAIKYAVQKHILRRKAEPDSPITVLFLDEYQNTVNSMDSKFLAECRSHHGCMIVMTQSIHSFYAEMGGHKGKAFADALLTNFGHKVFFTLGDDQSAAYASSLCGKTRQTFIGGSSAPQDSIWDDLVGVGKLTGTFSEHIELVMQNREFMQGLRTGGKANGYICDGWLIKSGEGFASGVNWMKVSFSQRG